jgi:hypothetical protein
MRDATRGDGKVVCSRKHIPEMEGKRLSTMDSWQPDAHSFSSALMTINPHPDFKAGAGKGILWYVASCLFDIMGHSDRQ